MWALFRSSYIFWLSLSLASSASIDACFSLASCSAWEVASSCEALIESLSCSAFASAVVAAPRSASRIFSRSSAASDDVSSS